VGCGAQAPGLLDHRTRLLTQRLQPALRQQWLKLVRLGVTGDWDAGFVHFFPVNLPVFLLACFYDTSFAIQHYRHNYPGCSVIMFAEFFRFIGRLAPMLLGEVGLRAYLSRRCSAVQIAGGRRTGTGMYLNT
jgi:hypothetical protein